MSDWAYNQQFRSSEAARQRNRREERLSQLNFNKGAEAECKFNIDQINKEQRIIEKELERIRMGVHKSPANASLLGPEKKFHHPHFHVFKIKDSEKRDKKHDLKKHKTDIDFKDISELNGEEDIDAFMIIEYLDKLQRSTSSDNTNRVPVSQNKSIDIAQTQSKTHGDIDQSKSYHPERSDPLKDTLRRTQVTVDGNIHNTGEVCQDLNEQSNSVDLNKSGLYITDDMTSVRCDNSKRYTKDPSPNHVTTADDGVKRKKSVTLIPDVTTTKYHDKDYRVNESYNTSTYKSDKGKMLTDETPRRQTFDPADMNPDGTMKTMHKLPPFEQAYKEAEKARYIRTKIPLERERVLTPNEIFDKSSK